MDMKSLLKKLVETESPSHDREAVSRVGAIVAEEARRLGAQVELIPNKETGDHVVSRFLPIHPSSLSLPPSKPILLLCHMDTVFPLGTLAKMPFREADGKIFGPGTLDMKAGIVICLAAIEELQNAGGLKQPVTLLCTSDEEIGSTPPVSGSKNWRRNLPLFSFLNPPSWMALSKHGAKAAADFTSQPKDALPMQAATTKKGATPSKKWRIKFSPFKNSLIIHKTNHAQRGRDSWRHGFQCCSR